MSHQTTQQSELVQVRAYTFEQLAEDAQERVKTWLNDDHNILHTYAEDHKAYYAEEAKKVGFDIDLKSWQWEINPIDGHFCADVLAEQFIKAHKLGKDYQSLLRYLRQDGYPVYIHLAPANQYYGSKQMIATEDWALEHDIEDYSPKALAQYENLKDAVLEHAQDIAHECAKAIDEDHSFMWSDEYAIDMCHANEYLFDETGKPIHHLIER